MNIQCQEDAGGDGASVQSAGNRVAYRGHAALGRGRLTEGRLGHVPRIRMAAQLLSILAFALLTGCSTNPNTGREQFLALPAVHAVQAKMGFSLLAGGLPLVPSAACGRVSPTGPQAAATGLRCAEAEQTAKFVRQVERIGTELAAEARVFAPELFQRIDDFQIGVHQDMNGGTGSSARGRIVLSSELSRLDPTDDVVAFLIAREMGHVIARHDEEDAGVRMVFSALTALIPGFSVIGKFAASSLGALGFTRTWATQQRREADEIALALLERTDRSRAVIALNLRAGLNREQLRAGQWDTQFAESADWVSSMVRERRAPQLLVAGKGATVAPKLARLSDPSIPAL